MMFRRLLKSQSHGHLGWVALIALCLWGLIAAPSAAAQRQFSSGDTSTWVERYGDGSDGSLTISSDVTESPIDSACTGTSGATSLSATNGSFATGQLVMIHQSRGAGAGQWELNRIDSYSTGTITLAYPLTVTYVTGAQVRVLRQYSSVSITGGGTYRPKAWNGSVGGILAFVCNGTTSVAGSINASQRGYSGGPSIPPTDRIGNTGEGTPGPSITNQKSPANGNGGAGGREHVPGVYNPSGGGGGGNGAAAADVDPTFGRGGLAAGNAALTSMVFGGGGGSGGSKTNISGGGIGGNGAGIVLIISKTITVTGSGVSTGGTGQDMSGDDDRGGPGGGGAGGSWLFKGQSVSLGSSLVSAAGGPGGPAYRDRAAGTDGAVGRIDVDYSASLSGSTNPAVDSTVDFTLADIPPPEVTAIDPESAPNSGPADITSITGSNFRAGYGASNGLVAYWPMNESSGTNVEDIAGTFEGTASGSDIVSGRVGQAREFDGIDDFVDIGSANLFNSTDLSISVWVMPGAFTNILAASSSSGVHPIDGLLGLQPDGRIVFLINDQDGSVNNYATTDSAGLISLGSWYHIVVTRTGTTSVSMYLNGSLVPSTRQCSGGGCGSTHGPLHAALARVGENSSFYNGVLDEVRVYDRAISAVEVAELYQYGGNATVKLQRSGQPDIDCTGFAAVGTTSLEGGVCDITGAEVGAWDVVVTNPDNWSGTLPGGFSVMNLPPEVTAIDPTTGVNDGPVNVNSITGANFVEGGNIGAGLVAHWPMDEISGDDVVDVTGNGYDAFAENAPIVVGRIGNGRGFDGSNSMANTGSTTLLSNATMGTICAWVNPASISGDPYAGVRNVIVGRASVVYDNGFGFAADSDVLRARLGPVNFNGVTPVTTGQWHFVAVTWDTSDVSLYLDGALDNSMSTGSAFWEGGDIYPTVIGRLHVPASNGTFDGIIDDVRMYDRALSAPEIAALAALGTAVRLTKAGQDDIYCTGFTFTDSATLSDGVCNIAGAEPGAWDVVVINPDGQSASLTGGFEIEPPCYPIIESGPDGAGVYCVGDTILLSATVSGDDVNYQWRKNGDALSNGGPYSNVDTDTLTIDSLGPGESGRYDLVASNTCGMATSSGAVVFVLNPEIDCDANSVPDCQEDYAVQLWMGGDFGSVGSFYDSGSWDPNGQPDGSYRLLIANQWQEENICDIGANNVPSARGIFLAGNENHRQILRVSGNLVSTFLQTCEGIAVLDGGVIEMRGGAVGGNQIYHTGDSVNGYGRIDATTIRNQSLILSLAGESSTLVFNGGAFENQAAGTVQAKVASTVVVNSDAVSQVGVLEARPLGAIVFSQPLINSAGGLISLLGGTLSAAGLQNDAGGEMSVTGSIDADLTNDGSMTVIADLLIAGDLTNSGTVYIQNGIMTVTGDLTNSGTILGGFGGRDGVAAGVAVFGDFASTTQDAAEFDLTQAVLQMNGGSGEAPQHLEVMAADAGPQATLPSAALFSIGTLRIGPMPTVVKLVDRHANSPHHFRRADGHEALYVSRLVLEPGVTLDLAGLRIYYGEISPAPRTWAAKGISVEDSVGGGGAYRIEASPRRTTEN